MYQVDFPMIPSTVKLKMCCSSRTASSVEEEKIPIHLPNFGGRVGTRNTVDHDLSDLDLWADVSQAKGGARIGILNVLHGGVCHQLKVDHRNSDAKFVPIISLLGMFSLPHCESPSQTVVVPLQKLAASGSTNPCRRI